MPKEIVIRIKSGGVEIEAVGFSGSECLDAARPYEKALGAAVERKKKPEFYSGKGVQQSERNRITY